MSKPFRVKELAQDRNITQEELASRARQHAGVNISLSTVRRIWQNNQAGSPRAETLLAIADVLGVTIKDLYAESDEQPATAPHANLGANKISLDVPA